MAQAAHLTEAAPLLVTRGIDQILPQPGGAAGSRIEVRAGEIVGVIGPNGSGKSTFFNLVTGFLRGPTRARAEFGGSADHAPSARPPSRGSASPAPSRARGCSRG